jgi:[protein-PII] uridylyltransferase
MNLLLEIEDIIEKNGTDFELSKLFKQYIKEYKESLHSLFENSQGKDFLVKHTKTLDSIIALMYKTILRRMFGNYLPMRNSIPISIIALGSYGREQLCVHSDIDLLIVYEEVDGYQTKLIIEKLFYLTLDSGLKLGHRVHTVSDLFGAACEDMTIKTALMEARFIVGSIFTWHNTQRELNAIRLHNQKEFILAKLEEAKIRRKKYPISMEPNIKESVGGLRDTQLLYWIARVIYGVDSLRELSGVVFEHESYRDYRIALELLYRVRSSLHLITSKQEDTLRLEYIPQVANMLGFASHKKLASKVIEAGWRIDNFTKVFAKKMIRPYVYDPKMISVLRENRIQKGVYELNNRLYVSYSLKIPPISKLLEILVSLEDKPYRFDAGLLSKFTYSKISHPLSKKTLSALEQLLRKKNSHCFLKLFYDAGVLRELFANFRKVTHMPQFDGYHHYPVDIHSIECVRALENIKEPFIQNLYDELDGEDKLLLKTVTLFHDTGKGRTQDHSEVGAKLIVPFLRQIRLKEESIARAVTLVKNHILMSGVAFKQNIHNEKTLYKFMSSVGDVKNLNLLYVLTYADINGVGGDTYNSFNAKLLFELYKSALEVSQNSGRITDAKKRVIIENKVAKHPDFSLLSRSEQKNILAIESNLFFFKHSVEEILEISRIARNVKKYDFRVKFKNSLTIEIYRKIPLNIGYLLSTLAHLNVANMEIFTLFDGVKYFRMDFIKNIDENELPQIEENVRDSFDMSKKIAARDIKIKREEISFDCEHSLTHAEINVQTKNQKGLLSYIMNCFEDFGVNVVTAKIHSSKDRAKDSFLVDKQNKICDNGEEIFKLLTKDS